MSLVEQKSTRKGQVDKDKMELNADNVSEKYKMEAIWDSAVYARKLESSHLLGLYYLVF